MNGPRIINPDAFIHAAKQVKAGRFGAIEAADFEMPAFDTKPLEDYEKPKDFPNCCDLHKLTYESAVDFFGKFPNCCTAHKKLLSAKWFKKEDYEKMPMRVVNTLRHTEDVIEKRINEQDWQEDITEYIEYCYHSFGSFPTDYGPPLGKEIYQHFLKIYLASTDKIPQDKRDRLIHLIDASKDEKEKAEPTDLNLLLDHYRKWVKEFPFNITLFKDAKPKFEKSFPPIFSGKPTYNRYLKTSKAKLITQKQLIDFLLDLTKEMLSMVKADEMAKEMSLSEITIHAIDLLNEDLRIKNAILFGEYSKGELKYMKFLKKWLTSHKNYFRDFSTLINRNEQVPTTKAHFDFRAKIADIKGQTNLFWRGLPMDKVVEHFIVLTERKSRNEKPFLTQEQLIIFLGKGFLGKKEHPKQKINLSIGEKGLVISKFYDFFVLSVSQYNELNKKFKYIKLLTDCFDNWDARSVESFFKPNKTKEKW